MLRRASADWRSYIDDDGDFKLAAYLYRTINDLMKHALDMGTLLSTDERRLRAFKEQIKTTFKSRWFEVAQALEAFDIIVPCGCPKDEFCRTCGGSRYRLNYALTPDELREISIVGVKDDPELQEKLQRGLAKALEETEHLQ